jgi:hypothetical protein
MYGLTDAITVVAFIVMQNAICGDGTVWGPLSKGRASLAAAGKTLWPRTNRLPAVRT